MQDNELLDNKIILITGASRGIGRAIAQELAATGATVIGTATTEKGAEAINEFATKGIVLDVTKQQSIDEALAKITQEYGAPAILINNAGITQDNLFMRMNDEEWDKVISANLSGVFKLMRACIRPMVKARWGRIINISSVVAFSGNPGQANYAAAKAGVIGMTKSVALEVASRGITVNVVAPGFIETDMTGSLTAEQQEKLLQLIPIGRMGQAKDIAHAVRFLVSEASGYITGETIHVNGGMLMN